MVRTSAAEVHSHIHVNSVAIVPAISVWQLRGMDQWLLGAARPTKAVFHSIPSLPTSHSSTFSSTHRPWGQTKDQQAENRSLTLCRLHPLPQWVSFVDAVTLHWQTISDLVYASSWRSEFPPSTISYYQKVLTNFSVVTRPPNALSRINIARMQFSGRMDANCRGQKLL